MVLRVLVVEDEFLIAADLSDLIEERGHMVVGSADTIESAITLAEKTRPQIATVDLRLKHGDNGADLAAALLEKLGIRSIFISGNLDEATRLALAHVNPIAFVGKPISPPVLSRALDLAVKEIAGASGQS